MARTKCILPFVESLCKQFDKKTEYDRQRRLASKYLVELYDIVYKGHEILTDAEKERLQFVRDGYLAHYNYLARTCESKKILRYKVTVKQNYLYHICWEACRLGLNPRLTMSLTGEDFVGRISTITKGSLTSTRMLELGSKVLSKYLVGLSIRWSGH